MNESLASAVRLATWGGLRWDLEDFRTMMKESSGYIPGEIDQMHAAACQAGNKSAADSIDHYQGRKPIKIGKWWHHSDPHNDGIKRYALRRVCIGFSWWVGGVMGTPEEGDLFTVTSFGEGGDSVIACSYHPGNKEEGYRTKVKSRRTFDRAYFSPPIPLEEKQRLEKIKAEKDGAK
ncbi:MAG: hypothetical protein WC911_01710 [Thermoleophilia bacterium]